MSFKQRKSEITLDEAAGLCGASLNKKGSGGNVRIDCPFACEGDHAGKFEISVNVDNPDKVWRCHNYQCECKGDVVDLINGMLTGKPPKGTRGKEFLAVKKLMMGESEPKKSPAKPVTPPPAAVTEAVESVDEEPSEIIYNVPLKDSENEAARKLVGMQQEFIRDPSEMRPVAAAYWRARECFLTTEILEEWQLGYIPSKGCSGKRGFSLRNTIAYPLFDRDGNELCYVGRDPDFQKKLKEFEALPPESRSGKRAPAKHRFMKGFHRGLELYGQQLDRFDRHPEYREFVKQHGLTVVEGFNDVLALDHHGVFSVGLMSNQVTDGQVAVIASNAEELADGKVNVLFDFQATGDDGARDALFKLAEVGMEVRLACSQGMYGGQFKGRQPENLSRDELWKVIVPPLKR